MSGAHHEVTLGCRRWLESDSCKVESEEGRYAESGPVCNMSSVDQNLSGPRIRASEVTAEPATPALPLKEVILRSTSVSGTAFSGNSFPSTSFPSTSIGVLVAMSIVSALLVPSRMLLSTGEPDDSSVFAYIGWAMKHGLMPYRDVWDHKGPLLYYLQYAGMSLRSTSTFGIGLLEVIALAFAFFFIYRVIASFASRFVVLAIAAFSIAFITHFNVGGNMCESWALLPLAAAHYASWRWSQRISRGWCAAVIGVAFACIFWIRPNMAAYPAIAMLVLLYASAKTEGLTTATKQLMLGCVAALGLTASVLVPLYRWGVFPEFVAAYFGYNAAYSKALSIAGRYVHTSQLLILLFGTAIAILGAAGWIVVAKESSRKEEVAGGPQWLYLQTLLWSLPFELAAASLSGRDYPHYLLPLFPTLVVLAAWFLSELENQTKAMPARPVLTALLVGLLPFTLLAYSGDFSHSTAPPNSAYLTVVRFIQRATTPADRIMVVGETETGYIALMAQRLPASRFVYQLPLIDANNPVAGVQRRQFMCDIAQNRPAIIVSGNPQIGILCASELECTLRNMQAPTNDYGYQSMTLPKLMRDFIASEYKPISDPRFGPFRVLLRKDIAIPTQW